MFGPACPIPSKPPRSRWPRLRTGLTPDLHVADRCSLRPHQRGVADTEAAAHAARSCERPWQPSGRRSIPWPPSGADPPPSLLTVPPVRHGDAIAGSFWQFFFAGREVLLDKTRRVTVIKVRQRIPKVDPGFFSECGAACHGLGRQVRLRRRHLDPSISGSDRAAGPWALREQRAE